MSLKKAVFIIFLVVLVDQISKIYIKTHFVLGESVTVFSWFKILFIENEGAAWGTKLSDIIPFISDEAGKMALTVFRLLAICGIGYWLNDAVKKNGSKVLVISIALIFAGAFGNIVDSVFYGVVFDHSYHQVATVFADEPYGSLFHGKVVDMLYFPMIDTTWPDWVPGVGGKNFRFFEPVFNLADSAISIGVGILLVFHKKAFPKPEEAQEKE
ncbi:lipoprotein signal peptidase [Sinomicrobium soli]|uniref:lipoprotein signal peptidase n=1 Tax=Sinomicrobium sp. N-1-3-6 TaxID=2219864 RepID=UPI000DCDE2E2|nr:lipoprotein signal peptidase [Sinomicrobium sp. N-1-3-6]RAV29608.1 lipoprotein signal peptidase [Sinomicrobium sp. N-1-3-6]